MRETTTILNPFWLEVLKQQLPGDEARQEYLLKLQLILAKLSFVSFASPPVNTIEEAMVTEDLQKIRGMGWDLATIKRLVGHCESRLVQSISSVDSVYLDIILCWLSHKKQTPTAIDSVIQGVNLLPKENAQDYPDLLKVYLSTTHDPTRHQLTHFNGLCRLLSKYFTSSDIKENNFFLFKALNNKLYSILAQAEHDVSKVSAFYSKLLNNTTPKQTNISKPKRLFSETEWEKFIKNGLRILAFSNLSQEETKWLASQLRRNKAETFYQFIQDVENYLKHINTEKTSLQKLYQLYGNAERAPKTNDPFSRLSVALYTLTLINNKNNEGGLYENHEKFKKIIGVFRLKTPSDRGNPLSFLHFLKKHAPDLIERSRQSETAIDSMELGRVFISSNAEIKFKNNLARHQDQIQKVKNTLQKFTSSKTHVSRLQLIEVLFAQQRDEESTGQNKHAAFLSLLQSESRLNCFLENTMANLADRLTSDTAPTTDQAGGIESKGEVSSAVEQQDLKRVDTVTLGSLNKGELTSLIIEHGPKLATAVTNFNTLKNCLNPDNSKTEYAKTVRLLLLLMAKSVVHALCFNFKEIEIGELLDDTVSFFTQAFKRKPDDQHSNFRRNLCLLFVDTLLDSPLMSDPQTLLKLLRNARFHLKYTYNDSDSQRVNLTKDGRPIYPSTGKIIWKMNGVPIGIEDTPTLLRVKEDALHSSRLKLVLAAALSDSRPAYEETGLENYQKIANIIEYYQGLHASSALKQEAVCTFSMLLNYSFNENAGLSIDEVMRQDLTLALNKTAEQYKLIDQPSYLTVTHLTLAARLFFRQNRQLNKLKEKVTLLQQHAPATQRELQSIDEDIARLNKKINHSRESNDQRATMMLTTRRDSLVATREGKASYLERLKRKMSMIEKEPFYHTHMFVKEASSQQGSYGLDSVIIAHKTFFSELTDLGQVMPDEHDRLSRVSRTIADGSDDSPLTAELYPETPMASADEEKSSTNATPLVESTLPDTYPTNLQEYIELVSICPELHCLIGQEQDLPNLLTFFHKHKTALQNVEPNQLSRFINAYQQSTEVEREIIHSFFNYVLPSTFLHNFIIHTRAILNAYNRLKATLGDQDIVFGYLINLLSITLLTDSEERGNVNTQIFTAIQFITIRYQLGAHVTSVELKWFKDNHQLPDSSYDSRGLEASIPLEMSKKLFLLMPGFLPNKFSYEDLNKFISILQEGSLPEELWPHALFHALYHALSEEHARQFFHDLAQTLTDHDSPSFYYLIKWLLNNSRRPLDLTALSNFTIFCNRYAINAKQRQWLLWALTSTPSSNQETLTSIIINQSQENKPPLTLAQLLTLAHQENGLSDYPTAIEHHKNIKRLRYKPTEIIDPTAYIQHFIRNRIRLGERSFPFDNYHLIAALLSLKSINEIQDLFEKIKTDYCPANKEHGQRILFNLGQLLVSLHLPSARCKNDAELLKHINKQPAEIRCLIRLWQEYSTYEYDHLLSKLAAILTPEIDNKISSALAIPFIPPLQNYTSTQGETRKLFLNLFKTALDTSHEETNLPEPVLHNANKKEDRSSVKLLKSLPKHQREQVLNLISELHSKITPKRYKTAPWLYPILLWSTAIGFSACWLFISLEKITWSTPILAFGVLAGFSQVLIMNNKMKKDPHFTASLKKDKFTYTALASFVGGIATGAGIYSYTILPEDPNVSAETKAYFDFYRDRYILLSSIIVPIGMLLLSQAVLCVRSGVKRCFGNKANNRPGLFVPTAQAIAERKKITREWQEQVGNAGASHAPTGITSRP